MNNPANMLRARIEFNRSRLKAMNERENEFKSMLTNADDVNGTSPATTQAVREVFAENVENNNDIKNMVQELLKKSKKRKISSRMLERMMEERRAKNARARVDKEETEGLVV